MSDGETQKIYASYVERYPKVRAANSTVLKILFEHNDCSTADHGENIFPQVKMIFCSKFSWISFIVS